MSKKRATLFTVGYERRDANELFDLLVENRVDLLLDVRYRAQSRKRGFSKSALAEACEHREMSYQHDRNLGTPPSMMEHVRSGAGYDAETSREYREFLLSQTESLESASRIIRTSRACLLCYEKDAQDCHRRIVADELSNRTGIAVMHL